MRESISEGKDGGKAAPGQRKMEAIPQPKKKMYHQPHGASLICEGLSGPWSSARVQAARQSKAIEIRDDKCQVLVGQWVEGDEEEKNKS